MSVGLKSNHLKSNSRERGKRSQSYVGGGLHRSHGQGSPATNLKTVPYLPNSRRTPLWLKSLVGAQRSSSVVVFLLIAAVMVVYGQTVYTQQMWSREYRKLETLQRHERQLTTTNESLKDQIVQQSEKSTTGLVPITSHNSIFVKPAPLRKAPSKPEASKPGQKAPQKSDSVDPAPMGY